MSKNRKKKILKASKLVKAMARAQIGQPKPTTVFKSGPKGGSQEGLVKRLENITVGGIPVSEFIRVSEPPPEHIPHVFSTTDAHPYVATQRNFQTSKYVKPGEVHCYSEEVLIHADFLLKSQGKEVMDQYLKEKRMSTPNPMMASTNGTGSLETALREAQEKVRFYTNQIKTATAEKDKWEAVTEGLNSTLAILTGKKTVIGREPNATRRSMGRKSREEDILNILRALPDQFSGHQGEDAMVAAQLSPTTGAAYQVMKGLVKKGRLIRIDRATYGLAERTEPAKNALDNQQDHRLE